MSQQIEIEFKNLVTEDEFNRLMSHFTITYDMFATQVNHYLETRTFDLKEKGAALRIREKGHKIELTLKQPAETGLLETNQLITEEEKTAALEAGNVPDGAVKSALEELVGKKEYQYFGFLTTSRAEKEYEGGLVVLDRSTYFNKQDFELEYEAEEEQKGKIVFSNLLDSLNIPHRATDNKIKRFFKEKSRMNQERP